MKILNNEAIFTQLSHQGIKSLPGWQALEAGCYTNGSTVEILKIGQWPRRCNNHQNNVFLRSIFIFHEVSSISIKSKIGSPIQQ